MHCGMNSLNTARKEITFQVQRCFKNNEYTATPQGCVMYFNNFFTCPDILLQIKSKQYCKKNWIGNRSFQP
jgi:hypothetical protein